MPRAVLVLCFALAFPVGVVTDALLPGPAGVCASAPGIDRPGTGCDEADDTADALDAMLDADEPADASPPVSRAAAWDLGARSRVD